jgi:hypothetical protein
VSARARFNALANRTVRRFQLGGSLDYPLFEFGIEAANFGLGVSSRGDVHAHPDQPDDPIHDHALAGKEIGSAASVFGPKISLERSLALGEDIASPLFGLFLLLCNDKIRSAQIRRMK